MSNSSNNPEGLKAKHDPFIREAATIRMNETPTAANWLINVANIVYPAAVQAPAPTVTYEQPAKAAVATPEVASTPQPAAGQDAEIISLRSESDLDEDVERQRYLNAIRDEVYDAHNDELGKAA